MITRPQLPFMLLMIAALLCAVQLLVTYPGQLIIDSEDQLGQALSRHYEDWHPPVMAFVWTYLIKISGSRGALLALHQALHWLGFGLIADGCYRANMVKRAWTVLAAGAFPLFLMYDKILLKDVGMGSAFVVSLGLVFWFLVQNRPVPWWAYMLSAVCLLYGGLVRTNAVFALGPLIYIQITRGREFSLVKILGCTLLVAAMAIPLSGWVNHRVIGARAQDPMQSLQIFDLMGIAVHAHDSRVWGERPPALSAIRSCYTAYWWDTFSPWRHDVPTCTEVRRQIGAPPDMYTIDKDRIALRGQLWRRAIAQHPLAYAVHRLSHFNSSIYFLVPSMHIRYAEKWLHATGRDIRLDYLKRNFLLWPVFWLAIAVCGLTCLTVPSERPTTVAVAKSLLFCGLLYSGAYLLVGVATDYRYHYWSIMAILLAVILAADEFPKLMIERPRRASLAAAFVIAVLLGGYAARVADINFV